MKRLITILAACACACAFAGVTSARLGSLGRNDTVVTNVTDVTPGNYETVSNRAMTASAYTDAALGAFAATGAVRRAEIYGTPTRWTDATGCVWEVDFRFQQIIFIISDPYELSHSAIPGQISWYDPLFEYRVYYDTLNHEWEYSNSDGTWTNKQEIVLGQQTITLYDEFGYAAPISFELTFAPTTNLVGRVALTNDIPRTAGDVGAYPAASGNALERGKQDALPYPTNAIPYAAISGAPSGGGQEWRVEWRALDAGQYVEFVTNGCILASFGDSVTLNYSRAAWPEGAAMFVRATGVPQSYWPYCREGDSSLRLVGYGTWPTNNFQSVWWRSGTNIYVNVILEE